MQLSVMLEPQEGLRYDDILAVAQRAEKVGMAGMYRSDHYSTVSDGDPVGSTDAWATIAGLARETARITIGTLVSPVTFRRVGNLAKVVATVDEMAGRHEGRSRVHVGMGTGWLEGEHRQHGFPFEDTGTRFRRLEEHLTVVRGLWDPRTDPFSHDGEFVTVTDARFRPQPQPRPRIIVGGTGRRTTPRLAATYADELNTVFAGPEGCAQMRSALDTACEQVGRDPASIPLSLMTGCIVGASEADYTRRARQVHAEQGHGSFENWLADLADTWVLGAPEQAADRLGRLAEHRVTGVMLQHRLPRDLDMLDVLMEAVAPRL